jgi:hypothetical protein
MSAMGSVIVTVGRLLSPARLRDAWDLARMGELPQAHSAETELAVHGTGTATPAAPGVRTHLELGLALLLLLQGFSRHGSLSLTTEWEAEGIEKSPALGIGSSGGHNRDVHASGGIDLVVVDLREDQLFGYAERVVAAAVEAAG